MKPVSVFVYNIKHPKDINYRDFKIECQQIWQLQVTAVSVKKLNPYLILYMLDKLRLRMSQIKILTFYISREYVSLCLTLPPKPQVCVNTDGELERKWLLLLGYKINLCILADAFIKEFAGHLPEDKYLDMVTFISVEFAR